MMLQAFQVALNPIYRKQSPVRNPLYTQFVKRFACVACGSTRQVDPCHTGAHALSQKASDTSVIPLCRKCHAQFDADPKGFAEHHELDIETLIAFFSHLWELKQRRTA
jgi:hypothetical protein